MFLFFKKGKDGLWLSADLLLLPLTLVKDQSMNHAVTEPGDYHRESWSRPEIRD